MTRMKTISLIDTRWRSQGPVLGILPDSVSDEQGALVEPAAVSLYAVDNSGLQAGNTVLISGAGPIGALTVLSVNALGALQIFVAEPNPRSQKTH
jgi:(R,R)-butanediol dehydrogenase/meso-butanediol dehydrogenase/diacetyl reductase